MSAHKIIATKVLALKDGILVFPTDFRGIGSESAIKHSLSRLVKERNLERLGHGIYVRPKQHPTLGKLYPSLEQIAQAIAEREQIRIKPTGSYALNQLGLSTQVPTKLVYITEGARRQIKIGKGSIRFKAATAKKLSLKGKISSLVILALDEIGLKSITVEMKEQIKTLLQKEDPLMLQEDLKLAPAWINDFLLTLNPKK